MPQLRLDKKRFYKYFRMDIACFDEILNLIKDDIEKRYTNLREHYQFTRRLKSYKIGYFFTNSIIISVEAIFDSQRKRQKTRLVAKEIKFAGVSLSPGEIFAPVCCSSLYAKDFESTNISRGENFAVAPNYSRQCVHSLYLQGRIVRLIRSRVFWKSKQSGRYRIQVLHSFVIIIFCLK